MIPMKTMAFNASTLQTMDSFSSHYSAGKRCYFPFLTTEEIEALRGDMTLSMSRDKYAGLERSYLAPNDATLLLRGRYGNTSHRRSSATAVWEKQQERARLTAQ